MNLPSYCTYQDICNRIHETALKQNLIIGIDGRCGSGKTTLADALSRQFNAPVIHMDDFFLPIALRTKDRLLKAGGNIHYERFLEEVINPLRLNQEINYRKFDCSVGDYTTLCYIPKSAITIIEGSYSHHPLFFPIYDISIFCTLSPEVQIDRILKRNGSTQLDIFKTKWIPMEEYYIKSYQIDQNSNIIYTTDR